ncbi:MAG TPA: CPBP family intramembrane glutamic endopeptidase [Anaerolineales bacterium]|nr:CPBP family intramembrane glutamic endopeptidase [Anaerolineales bacterium]
MYPTIEDSASNKNKWIILAWGYVFLFSVIAAHLNYTNPYHLTPSIMGYPLGALVLWTGLYLPLLLPIFAHWQVKDFGFSINPALVLASILIAGLFAVVSRELTTWSTTMFESFARTGEEVFFRGFVYLLLLKALEKKQKPWLWAVIGSSVVFTLVHTQLLQAYMSAGAETGSAAFVFVSRTLNIFLGGLIFALLRHWTKSILPGAIAHGVANGGIMTILFVLLIYAMITYWAYVRKETIFSGFHRQANLPV